MQAGELACITTPKQGNKIPQGAHFCADNGCFGGGYPGDDGWKAWVSGLPRELCDFVVAPDVVGDATGTLERSRPFLPWIREQGFPAAFVAQDGCEDGLIPWDEFDVLFLGGSTEWKLGPAARVVTAEAKSRGLLVHMGRVNSASRMRYAAAIGCDSSDGTYLAFGPNVNLPKLLGWLRQVHHPALF